MVTLENWRVRMSEDMRLRDFRPRTQEGYMLAVRQFLDRLQREPETLDGGLVARAASCSGSPTYCGDTDRTICSATAKRCCPVTFVPSKRSRNAALLSKGVLGVRVPSHLSRNERTSSKIAPSAACAAGCDSFASVLSVNSFTWEREARQPSADLGRFDASGA